MVEISLKCDDSSTEIQKRKEETHKTFWRKFTKKKFALIKRFLIENPLIADSRLQKIRTA